MEKVKFTILGKIWTKNGPDIVGPFMYLYTSLRQNSHVTEFCALECIF